MFGLFVRVLERGKFLYNKMAELVAEVEESVVDGFSFDPYTGILSWVENREFVTLRTLAATNRRRNPKSPGNSEVNGNLKDYDVYRQKSGGGMK